MIDIVDQSTRSRMMSGIRAKNTKPEMTVRRGLHRAGLRYKLHDKTLPGRPDIVFPKFNAVIFVNGCFWHGHDCRYFKWPKTREDFWKDKITSNKLRDARDIDILRLRGVRCCLIWECAVRNKTNFENANLIDRIIRWLKAYPDDEAMEFLELADNRY